MDTKLRLLLFNFQTCTLRPVFTGWIKDDERVAFLSDFFDIWLFDAVARLCRQTSSQQTFFVKLWAYRCWNLLSCRLAVSRWTGTHELHKKGSSAQRNFSGFLFVWCASGRVVSRVSCYSFLIPFYLSDSVVVDGCWLMIFNCVFHFIGRVVLYGDFSHSQCKL